MTVKLGVMASLLLMSSVAMAECESGSTTVFSCTTVKGKVIEVCDSGATLDYAFGKPSAKPEIVVRVPRDQASTHQWQGIGRYHTYTVEIPNGNTTYSVFWGMDSLSEKHEVEAGVHVLIKEALAATVNCATEKPIVQNLEGIDLKPAD